MRLGGINCVLLGLSTALAAWGTVQAQEPKGAAPPKASAAHPAAGGETVAPAVDRLVEQLRRYPARRSTAAVQLGLFLIDAEGGEATLIANEPEPWLNHCGSPAWSHDGRRIVFDVTNSGGQAAIARLKALDLVEGRLERKDLGPGNCPDFSPTDDRILFVLNPGSVPGGAPGVWLMRADGAERRLLGSYGRPKWSPDGSQTLIVGSAARPQVTIMDVRPEKSGVLGLPEVNLFSVPSWAAAGTVVAAVGSSVSDTLALIDVTEPDQARVKEILWKSGKGPDLWPAFPSYPVYSPATRRCVFVGTEDGKGKALYSIQLGKPGPPKRLEKEGFDARIQDLACSPDGRYVLFVSDRVGRSKSSPRRQSVDAPALSGITIDGDLKDWPAAMPRYPIQNMQAFPNTNGPGRREHAFLTTSPDLSAAFSVGYDPKAQLIYLAVIVRDDQLIVGHTSPWDTDSVEVYIDGLHSDTADAGAAPVLQYIGLPGKGPVYGIMKPSGQGQTEEDNPILMVGLVFGDIKQTKTRMAFRRVGDVTTYEWAIQAFDHYPDQPTKLLPGVQIGFDLTVCDKDKPAQTPQAANDPEEDRQAWVVWGPPWRRMKHLDAGNLGEFVLGRAPSP